MKMTLATLCILIMIPTQGIGDEYYYGEIGIGANINLTGCSGCWEDAGGPGAFIELGKRWERDGYYIDAAWTHLSQYFAGRPINDKDESSVDHFGVRVGMRFN